MKDIKGLKDRELISSYKYAPAGAVQTVDRLIQLKKTKDPWVVIEKILAMWATERPKEYKSFIVTLENTKATRKVTSVGNKRFRGVTKKDGSFGRAILDLPVRIHNIIRTLYDPSELPMNKEFFEKFIRKFPKFRIAGAV